MDNNEQWTHCPATQLVFTCLKSAIETLEKDVNFEHI